jgi:hypothetical protein
VIAEPNSSTTAETQAESVQSASKTNFEDGPLSAAELYQLTLYKWRYSLEAYGFDQAEVRDLMFLKWLHASRRVVG